MFKGNAEEKRKEHEQKVKHQKKKMQEAVEAKLLNAVKAEEDLKQNTSRSYFDNTFDTEDKEKFMIELKTRAQKKLLDLMNNSFRPDQLLDSSTLLKEGSSKFLRFTIVSTRLLDEKDKRNLYFELHFLGKQ